MKNENYILFFYSVFLPLLYITFGVANNFQAFFN